MNKQQELTLQLRMLVSVAAAIAIAATTYLCAWYQLRGHWYFMTFQYQTLRELESLHEALDQYHQEHGKYPERLAELNRSESNPFRVDELGQVVDPSGTPMQYAVQGDSFTLFSFGRDHQPGGVGWDADLYERGRRDYLPTLYQFSYSSAAGPIAFMSILGGIAGFFICLRRGKSPGSMVRTLAKFAITLIASVVAVFFMGVLHVLNGH